MLRCPAADVSYFELLHNARPEGYFVLSRVGGQIRLADLRVLSENQADWTSACAVAVRAAERDPNGCELMTQTSDPRARVALEANGFRARGEVPIFVLDPGNLLGDFTHISLGMLDDDSAYLRFPANPYCT
jgi:hypothetical protein